MSPGFLLLGSEPSSAASIMVPLLKYSLPECPQLHRHNDTHS